MNNKQRSILNGRKPKHRAGDKLGEASRAIRGMSPLVSCFEWVEVSEQLRQAIYASFCVPAEWLEPGVREFSLYNIVTRIDHVEQSLVGAPSNPESVGAGQETKCE